MTKKKPFIKFEKKEQQIKDAMDLHTSLERLKELYREGRWEIDWALARNPNTPHSLLESYYQRHDIFLLKRLAQNIAAPEALLMKLSKEYQFEIQEALIDNINTPVQALLNIVKSGDKYLKDRAQKAVTKKLNALQKLWLEK